MGSPNRDVDLVRGYKVDISVESCPRIPSRGEWLVLKPDSKDVSLSRRLEERSDIDMERAVAVW